MNCPICDSRSDRAFQKHGYWIRECQTCHHQFCELQTSEAHLSAVYGEAYFTGGGAGYSDYLGEADLLIAHGERYGKLLQRYLTPAKVLDVGAAAGFVLKGLCNSGWDGRGLEPNPQMAEYARTTLGLDVEAGSLETFHPGELFDLVTMIQVVPHFYELRHALQSAADVTRPGGHWLIETWDKDSWFARMFGKNWHEYSPPSVLHWFSLHTLTTLAEQFGFSRVASGRPSKWLNAAHAKSLADYKLRDSKPGRAAMRVANIIPDGTPIPYPTFDLFWVLFKKQI